MRLTPGTRVGPYEVVALLGAGGMAEVYRAKDTRLGREVAIKVVSEALGGDGAFLERFDREAKLAASLAHPNVVALFDVGLQDGKPYFVTELLQGESLRERLAKGPIPLAKALEWAAQMAHDGLRMAAFRQFNAISAATQTCGLVGVIVSTILKQCDGYVTLLSSTPHM